MHSQESSKYQFPFPTSSTRTNEKGWKCGDPYQHPIEKPKGGENPWEVLFDDLHEADKSQCAAWKDEVDNLLVFAGLFSAVVTAFVIETYKTLSSDPNDTIINVLSIIASRLGDNSTIVASDPFQTKFVPPKTFVRVNIYFLLSLILSLSAALVGIVCLQWLRQHRSYPASLSAEHRFALLHMRIEAFRRWKVPAIFTTLPVLVQAALVLFFVGLVEFVWHIEHTVIIPVALLIVAIMLFLVLTTIIPTLQVFPLHNPYIQVNTEVPVECPYRSPQAAIFRRLITSSTIVFRICSAIFTLMALTPLLVRRCYLWLRDLIRSLYKSVVRDLIRPLYKSVVGTDDTVPGPENARSSDGSQESTYRKLLRLTQSTLPKKLLYIGEGPTFLETFLLKTWTHDSWNKFDINWMTIRDTYFRHGCGKTSFLYRYKDEHINNPNGHMKHYYDAIQGLRKTIVDNFSLKDESLIFAAFHCAQALPVADLKNPDANGRFDPIPILRTRNHYLSKILRFDKNRSITHLSDILQNPTSELLLDENACIFLDFVASRDKDRTGGCPHTVSKTFAEVQFRLFGYLYGKSHLLKSDALESKRLVKPLIIRPRNFYFMPDIGDQRQPFVYQWSLVLHSFFRNLVDLEFDIKNLKTEQAGSSFSLESDVAHTFIAHPIFQPCLSYFCKEIWYNPSPRAISQSIETLKLVKDSLQKLLLADHQGYYQRTSHRLFYCASYYFHWIYRENPDSPALLKALDLLHPVLKEYKERLKSPLPELSEKSKIIGNRTWESEDRFYPPFSTEWWKFLDEWDLDSRLRVNSDGQNFALPAIGETTVSIEKESTDENKKSDNSLGSIRQDIKAASQGNVPVGNSNAPFLV